MILEQNHTRHDLEPKHERMKIDCQECGTRILAEDLDLPSKMAKCRQCNAVFSFAHNVPSAPVAQRERLRAPRPDGLLVHETALAPSEPGYRDAPRRGDAVTVTRRWFAAHHVFLAFFCIAWDGFLVFWYANLGNTPGPFSIIAAVFPIAHVAVGIGLTYSTLAGFLNKTTFVLDEQTLTVRHGPLPWKGNHTLARTDIKQLYCEESVSRNNNGVNRSYYLSAVLVDGQQVRLGSMPMNHAKYIEDLLEEHLGLADMHVPGEVGPVGMMPRL